MGLMDSDRISVKIHSHVAQQVKKCYGDFGWSLAEEEEDKLYENTTHLTFVRPHFIENKDDLQLLQVKLEFALNKSGRYENKKGSLAGAFALTLSIIACAILLMGVKGILESGLLYVIIGAVCLVLAAAVGIVCAVISKKIYLKECIQYDALIAKELVKIDEICAEARRLRGADEQ